MKNLSNEALVKALAFATASPGLQGAIPGFEAEVARRKSNASEIENELAEGLMRWQWNDKIGNLARKSACLIVSPEGKVFRFSGQDISNVAKVLKSEWSKRGKWSNTTYTIMSRIETAHISWRQDWDDGLFWPQASWEEAIAWVKSLGPKAQDVEIKAIIRNHWPVTASKFDKKSNFFS